MRCHIFISSTISSSNTALIICMRNFFLAQFSGVTFSWETSTHYNIVYWVTERKIVLPLVLYYGALCGSSSLFTVPSTLGIATAANFGDRQGGATLGTGGAAFSIGGAVSGGGCWYGFTLGGGAVSWTGCVSVESGHIGDATTVFFGYVLINSLLVTLVFNRGDRRSEELWWFSFVVVSLGFVGVTSLDVSVWSCSLLFMVVVLMNMSFRLVKACRDDYLRQWGILPFSSSAKLEAVAMTAYSDVMVGFVMYLWLKILSLILLVCVSPSPICSNTGSSCMVCLAHMPSWSVLQFFCVGLDFCV